MATPYALGYPFGERPVPVSGTLLERLRRRYENQNGTPLTEADLVPGTPVCLIGNPDSIVILTLCGLAVMD